MCDHFDPEINTERIRTQIIGFLNVLFNHIITFIFDDLT